MHALDVAPVTTHCAVQTKENIQIRANTKVRNVSEAGKGAKTSDVGCDGDSTRATAATRDGQTKKGARPTLAALPGVRGPLCAPSPVCPCFGALQLWYPTCFF
jgi:hypothetical protein